jgi:hypothetical protein
MKSHGNSQALAVWGVFVSATANAIPSRQPNAEMNIRMGFLVLMRRVEEMNVKGRWNY